MHGRDNINGGYREANVDAYTNGLLVIDTDHSKVHESRKFSIEGKIDVATTKAGGIHFKPNARTAASITSDMTNATSDVTLTAKTAGVAGNAISVTYVDPGANNAALAVTVTGTDIVISLATNGSGTITTTAAQVKALINDQACPAYALVSAEDEGAGSGVVNALAKASLTGGLDAAYIHLKEIVLSATGGPVSVSVIEDATLTGSTAAVPSFNRNRNSARTSQTTIVGGPDISVSNGSGVLTLATVSIPGTATGAAKMGGNTGSSEEWILNPNKNYVLAFSNPTAGTVTFGYKMTWYE